MVGRQQPRPDSAPSAPGGGSRPPSAPNIDIDPVRQDQRRLAMIMSTLLGIEMTLQAWFRSEHAHILKSNEIDTFHTKFLALRREDIYGMEYPERGEDGRETGSTLVVKQHVGALCHSVQAYWHDKSFRLGKPAEYHHLSKNEYDLFRIQHFECEEAVVPWGSSKRKKKTSEFSKRVKPSRSDYKVFKDDTYWLRHKENWLMTAESQGMLGALLLEHKVQDKDEDRDMCQWMFKTMSDSHQSTKTKTIVDKYLKSRNSRACWKELVDTMADSKVQELHAQRLSTILTSSTIKDWNGPQSAFISYFQRVSKDYNELQTDPQEKYSDKQLMQFVDNAVRGAENLRNVLSQMKTQYRTHSLGRVPSAEFFKELISAAEAYDFGNTKAKRTTSGRYAK